MSKNQDKRTGRSTVHRGIVGARKSKRSATHWNRRSPCFFKRSGERLRELTLRDYRRHFRYFSTWMQESHAEIETLSGITAPVIREYIHYLSYEKPLYDGHPYREQSETRKGLSPRDVNVRINTLKAMFRWFYQERLISENPTENLSRQRVEEDRIGAFTDVQSTRDYC